MNPNMPPANGYSFVAFDQTRFKAASWSGLVRVVEAYYRRLERPTEGLHDEVWQQIAGSLPAVRGKPPVMPRRSPRDRALRWLGDLVAARKRGVKLVTVPPAERDARRAICGACPHCARVFSTGCLRCRNAVAIMRKELLGGPQPNTSLGACAVLGEETATSSCLEQVSETNPALPNACWRKKSL
jgi:hypothetical protein